MKGPLSILLIILLIAFPVGYCINSFISAGESRPKDPKLNFAREKASSLCHANDTIPGTKSIVELYIMSKCPYGARAVEQMSTIVEQIGEFMDLRINFIASYNSEKDTFKSLHGQPEVDGDLWEICAINKLPQDYAYLPFLKCASRNGGKGLPGTVQSCCEEVGINCPELEECVTSDLGKELLIESIKRTKRNDVHTSPTIFIGGTKFTSQRKTESVIRAICKSLHDSESVLISGDEPEALILFGALLVCLVIVLIIAAAVFYKRKKLAHRHQDSSFPLTVMSSNNDADDEI